MVTAAAVLAGLVSSSVAATDRQAAASADWTRFGYDAARGNAAPSGIAATALSKLTRRRITIDGTVDSSAIYLKGVVVHGAKHDTAPV